MGKLASKILHLLASLIAGAAPLSAGAEPLDAAGHWRGLTETDLKAAYRLLAEDHPGSAPELGDEEFQRRLASGFSLAMARAAQVNSFPGYVATLRSFAVGMGDKHISAGFLVAPAGVHWAGLVTALQGSRWVVVDQEGDGDDGTLRGARLISCDGTPADRLAEERLGGFRAVWSVPAQRIQASPWLLVDDGNPFLTRPQTCLFERDGVVREVPLAWRVVARTDLVQRLGNAVKVGSAGMGVRRVGEGYWIGLESLSPAAEQVAAAVGEQVEEIRRAPWIVLDLRGNGGGNSMYGDRIAGLILGEQAVLRSSGVGGEDQSCDVAWRVSERNLARLQEFRETIRSRRDPAAIAYWDGLYDRALAAQEAGSAFTGPTRCSSSPSSNEDRKRPGRSAYDGRLFILTDHLCFSSCLLVTDRFRHLGAVHIGTATDAATHYYEVRGDRLPSALAMFETLQAFAPASPPQIGPFEPDLLFEGDISDTAALEAWIPNLRVELPRRTSRR
jgi:hypothetical protein